jgi:hypothetical protein
MREVYSKAESTIVIDENLERSSRYTDGMEILGVLTLADWMTRLWTVQESVLSRRVQLLFGHDKLLDFGDVIRTAAASYDSALTADFHLHGGVSRLYDDLTMYIGCLRGLSSLFMAGKEQPELPRSGRRPLEVGVEGVTNPFSPVQLSTLLTGRRYVPSTPTGRNIMETLLLLHHRRTSHKDDEAICLTVLLGLDRHLDKVIGSPADPAAATSRYERLLHLLEEAPRAFIFSNVPRLRSAYMKWAPQSFMGAFDPGDYFMIDFSGRTDKAMCRIMPEGLLTKASGLRIDIAPPFRTGTPMIDRDGTVMQPLNGRTQNLNDMILLEYHHLGISCPTCSTPLQHIITFDNHFLHAAEDAERNLLSGSHGKVEWAVVIKKDVYVAQSGQCYKCNASSKYGPLAVSPAVVVRIRLEQDGIIYASHQASVTVRLYQRAMDNDLSRQIVT